MATRSVIEAQDTTPLDSLERELVRQIINLTGRPGTATYIESEARMDALTASQCQIIRALILDYDEISLDTTRIFGGSRGADISAQRDREAIATELRRMLYPTSGMDVNGGLTVYTTSGTIKMVPVEYQVGTQDDFE